MEKENKLKNQTPEETGAVKDKLHEELSKITAEAESSTEGKTKENVDSVKDSSISSDKEKKQGIDYDFDDDYDDFDDDMGSVEYEDDRIEEIPIRPAKTKVLTEEIQRTKTREKQKNLRLAERREKRHFWTFTIIITVVTIVAVLLILFQRGILGGGHTETTSTAAVVNTTAETTGETQAETTLAETEVETTEVPSSEVRGSVLDNYTNIFIADKTSGTLNVRAEASVESSIVGTINAFGGGSVLSVTDDGWYEISSGGITGYVASQFVSIGSDAESIAADHAAERVKVNADSLNIRASASTSADVIGSAANGSVWEYVATEGDFYEIRLSDGSTGYVSQSFSTLSMYLEEAVAPAEVTAE